MKDRRAALAAMGAGALALFLPGTAKSHHRDASFTTRLTALEASVTDLKNRVAALETGTTPTSARYTLTNAATSDRVLDAALFTENELARVLATLITDLGLKA